MTESGTCGSCSKDGCSENTRRPGENEEDYKDRQQLASRMCCIKHKVVVLSGKGGVGKSTVATNLAVSLSLQGNNVGLLDIDIHGPSVPRLLNLENSHIESDGVALQPVEFSKHLKVMSIGFMLEDRSDAVVWRGPMKYGVIKQFLKDVNWGELDYLIIDAPPGTGDEPLTICQLIEDADGAVIVTTPQEVALLDVRKSISFCKKIGIKIIGVIENMRGFVCPKCGEVTEIFPSAGAGNMALEMNVPFLGSVPIDPAVAMACDNGLPYIEKFSGTPTSKAFDSAIAMIIGNENKTDVSNHEDNENDKKEIKGMRIAIPVAEGKLAMHFGHCEQFAIIDVDEEKKEILNTEFVTPPPHEPGVIPKWVAERGANLIIAGGMGSRAQDLFKGNNITVVVGASSDDPEAIVMAYMNDSLSKGDNVCDH